MRRLLHSIAPVFGGFIISLSAINAAKADAYQSNTGFSQPTRLLTFDEVVLPVAAPLTNQYASFGVTFSGVRPTYDPYAPPGNNNPNITGHAFSNFKPNVGSGALTITFNSPAQSVAMSLISQTGVTHMSTFLGSTLVETHNFSTNTTSSNNYYGFTNSNFDSLLISVNSGDNAFIADNLQFKVKAVPAPSALVTALFGAAPGIMLLRRRKRSR